MVLVEIVRFDGQKMALIQIYEWFWRVMKEEIVVLQAFREAVINIGDGDGGGPGGGFLLFRPLWEKRRKTL